MFVPRKLVGTSKEVSSVCARIARAEVLDFSFLDADDLVDCRDGSELILMEDALGLRTSRHVRPYAIAEAVIGKAKSVIPDERYRQLFDFLVARAWGPLGLMGFGGHFIQRKAEFQLRFIRACLDFSPQWDACGARFALSENSVGSWGSWASGTLVGVLRKRDATLDARALRDDLDKGGAEALRLMLRDI